MKISSFKSWPIRRLGIWFIWALTIFLLFKILWTKLNDPDLWWHLAAGRAMWTNCAFLKTDIFSHTFFGEPWINFEWLSQIFLFGAYQIGGFPLLLTGKIGVSFLAWFLLLLSIRKAGARGPWLWLLAMLGFGLLRPRFLERPELASLVLLALFVWLPLLARQDPRRFGRWVPWALFGGTVLWANLHGGFVYGIALLFFLWMGAVWAKENRAVRGVLSRSFTLCLVGLLINPRGPKIVSVFLEHWFQMAGERPLIQEWMPPDVNIVPLFWILFVLCGLLVLRGLIQKKKHLRYWIPSVIVFAVWGSFYFRNAPLLGFVALPFVAEAFPMNEVRQGHGNQYLKIGGWLACLFVMAAMSSQFRKPFKGELVDWSRFPKEACRFIEENAIKGTMYNTYGFGGYIAWALGPERKVFMDGRYLFYPFLEVERALNLRLPWRMESNSWPQFLEEHGVDYAIAQDPEVFVRYNDARWPFHLSLLNFMFPRQDWALVFWDDVSYVFVKRGKKFNALIGAHEFKTIRPYNEEQMRFLLAAGVVSGKDVRKEIERHQKIFPSSTVRDRLAGLLQ